jgi:beta-lactamase regulating signal transducer with metallopeptidase domain
VTFGWVRPVVVLPADVAAIGRGERRIVFAHERCHLQRAHGLTVILEEVLAAVVWVQPMVRRIIDERRLVREELCDRDAVARLGIEPEEYAAGLLAVAAHCPVPARYAAALSATASAAALRVRFAALIRRSRWSVPEVIAILLLAIALLPGIQPAPGASSHHFHFHDHSFGDRH